MHQMATRSRLQFLAGCSALAVLPAAGFATTTYTTSVLGSDLLQGSVKLATYSTESTCISAAKSRAVTATTTFECRTHTSIVATVTPTTPPVSNPPPGSGGSPGSTPPGSGSTPGAPGFYTDLSSAPVGAKVTAYGSGFGTSGTVTLNGTVQQIVSYSDGKVVFTVSGSGGALIVGGKSLGTLPVHPGRVLEATPANLKTVWTAIQPGDVVYLRGGTYNQVYGEGDWCTDCTLETFKQGTATQPIALVGYPGESVMMTNINSSIYHATIDLGDQNSQGRKANYLTFAGFTVTGNWHCIYGGGNTSDPSGGPDLTGGANIRVVGLNCQITDTTSNTETGMIALQGSGWKILGNTFVNPSNRVVINNNHAVYIQGGASNVEVAYNQFVNLRMGHVVQVHQDGTPKLYANIRVHDNLLQAASSGDMRGMNVGNVSAASTVFFDHNTLRNVGQDFSGIAVYSGIVSITNNLFYAIKAPDIDLNAGLGVGTRKVTATGNRFETVNGYPFVQADNGANLAEISLSGNSYCGQPPPSQDPSPVACK